MKKKGSIFLVLILLINTILQGVSGASLAFAQEQTSPSSALVSNPAETAKKEDSGSSSSETQKSTVNKSQETSGSSSQESNSSTSQTTSAAAKSEDDDDALPPGPPPTPTAIVPTVTIKPNARTAYRTDEQITTYVDIDGTSLTSDLEGPYLDIEMPTTLYPGGKVLNTDAYLDNFTVPTEGITLIKSAEKIVENGKTIYRIRFNSITSTTKISIPYVFSFTNGLVPKDYKLQPKVTLKSKDGTVLYTGDDKEYTPTYPNMNLTKVVATSSEDGQLLYGGTAKTEDPTRISETGAEPIPFSFTYQVQANSGQQRMMKKVVIKDTLPTYTNSHGQLVTAKFDQALNPGWTYDSSTGTVTYTKEFLESEFDTDFRHNIDVSKAMLYLSFPDAKYKDGNNKPNFTNQAEITATPFNPSPNEEYKNSDDITFNLIADDFSGTGLLSKRTEHQTVQHDVAGLYAQRLDYTVKVENKLSKPLREITLVEDASKFDSRLYFTSVDSFFERQGSNSKPINDKMEIRAYKSDGTYDTFAPGDQINKDAQDELNTAAEKIRNGELTEAAVPAVTPKYTKITIHFIKGYELPVGKYIDGFVYMAFKDPYHVPYSATKDIKNVVGLEAKVKNSQNQDVPINISDEWNKQFVPFIEKIRLSKNTDGQTSGIEGESVFFLLGLNFEQLSKARYLKNPTLVDLLPKGVSIEPGVDKTKAEDMLEAIGLANLDMIDKFSVIENYNGSGRTAIKIKLKSGLVKDLNNGRGYAFKLKGLKINSDIIPSKAETPTFNNTNELYFYQDNGQPFPDAIHSDSNQIVDDERDINMNGDTTDKVVKATSKVIGNVTESLQSVKMIRSTEPLVEGGPQYYGRDFSKDGIETEYGGLTSTSGHFQYDLQVRNYYDKDLTRVEIYDVLPHVGDSGRTTAGGAESAFSNTLTGPITVKVGDEDKTAGFDIYYRTDKYPSMNAATEVNSSHWTKNPGDYKDVTAIRIVSKTGTVIHKYTILHAILDMKAPAYDKDHNIGGKTAVNTFQVKYNTEPKFGESNVVTNKVNKRITIPVEKKWRDSETTHSKITAQLYATWKEDGVAKEELKEEKELSDSNNWKDTFSPLPDEESAAKLLQKAAAEKKITDFKYVVREKEIPPEYDADYSGDAQNGFVITNTRYPSIKIQKLWYDKDGNPIANDQLPKKLEVKLYRTTDGQTQNGELVETIQLERNATAPYLWEATKRYPPKDKTTDKYYTYYIEEVVPKYYLEISNASEKKVTFTDANISETATLTVKNKVNPTYPNTGGSGILPYLVLGIISLFTAVILYYMQKTERFFGGE